jgi:transposase
MSSLHYVGLDVHKKVIAYCVKTVDGGVVEEGSIAATRSELSAWAGRQSAPWIGALEATLFTGWIYDFLKPHAQELKVAHPAMLKAISASKKKNDRVDARKIADLLRCDLLPECHMVSAEIRTLRQCLRFRGLMVREAVKMKNKTAGLLMECGVEYTKSKLHYQGYFNELMSRLTDVPEEVMPLLRQSRAATEMFQSVQKRLIKTLREDTRLKERVARLMTIPCVGEVTALTWALEVGEPERFSSVRRAVSYCGLCGAQVSSAGKEQRSPISKQRNKHLQRTLVEAAKLAPRFNTSLAAIHERELARGNRNRATLAVARKLVAYLLAVDKGGKNFEQRGAAMEAAEEQKEKS